MLTQTDNLIFEAYSVSVLDSKLNNIKKSDAECVYKNLDKLPKDTGDLRLLINLFKDWHNGVYREIPWYSIAAIILGFLYLISPVDLVPDMVPVLGQVDDVVIIRWILTHIAKQDLNKYRQFKTK
nr:MAG TPA: Protein of unknown function (DUF1232) [Caudoviricetes sp.]